MANIFTGRRVVNVAFVGVPVIARNRSNCSRFLLTACAGLNYTIDRVPNPCNELFNQIISLLLLGEGKRTIEKGNVARSVQIEFY